MSVEGRPLIEQDLIQRARNGDVAAFEELVRTHQAIALRVAVLVMGDRSDAEDVTQEAFVKAYHALGRFRQDSRFRPWLLRIVRNEALNNDVATAARTGSVCVWTATASREMRPHLPRRWSLRGRS